MNRDGLRRGLAWSLVATLLLPVPLAVVLGLGALLGSLGDSAGAVACGRLGLCLGVAWLAAIVATELGVTFVGHMHLVVTPLTRSSVPNGIRSR